MDNKIFLVGILVLILFVSGCSEEGENYEIVGDSVMVNDNFLFMNVTPHTIHGSDWVELEFESKLFTGEIDFVFGFNTSDGVYPTRSQLYHENEQLVDNETEIYTCDHEFNYTTNPNFFTCYNEENSTLIFEHEFTGGNIPEQTAWWQELRYDNWVSWKPDNSINYDYLEMDKWFYSKNQSIVANHRYKIRYFLEVPMDASDGKYILAIKPSSETVSESIENGHFWALDPWYDTPSLDTDLLAYYSFDTDDYAGDKTGNGFNLSSSSPNSRDPIHISGGKINQSYEYLGASYGTPNEKFDVDICLDDEFTIAGWVKTNEQVYLQAQNFWGADNGALAVNCQQFVNDGEFKVTFSGANIILSDDFKCVDAMETWQFVVQKHDGTDGYIYVGNSTDMQNWTGTFAGTEICYTPFIIGDAWVVHDNSYFNGTIDELGIWNRSLSNSEILTLYNNYLSLYYEPVGPSVFNETTVNDLIITPAVAYAESGSLNCSAQINLTSGLNYNAEMNWSNATYSTLQNFNGLTNGTYISGNITLDPFVSGDNWNCSIYAYQSDNVTSNGVESAIRTISDTDPVWSLNPNNLTIFHTDNVTLQYTCTDPDGTPAYDIFNFTGDLITPLTINGTGYINNDPTFYDEGTFDYNITCTESGIEINQTLNLTVMQNINFTQRALKDPVSEGSAEKFFLDISIQNYSGTPSLNPVAQFNGSTYVGSVLSSGTVGNTNYWNFSTSSFAVLNESGTLAGFTQRFNWTLNLTDVLSVDFETNETPNNVTVFKMAVDDCSVYGTEILNLTLKDEKTTTGIAGEIQVDLRISSWIDSSVYWNFNETWTNSTGNTTRALVCVPNSVLNESDYMIYITSSYIGEDGVQEFFFLDYGNLSSLSTFNSHTEKTMDLFSLNATDSQSFLLRYVDLDGLVVDDILIHAYRRYIGEGVFREVERGRQNDEGETELHLVEEDIIYQFLVTQNSTILFTSNQFQAICQVVPCTVDLEEGGDFIPFGDDWDLVSDGGFSISSDGATREVTLTFTASNTSQWNLTLYKYNNNPADATEVNTSSITAMAGTVTVHAPLSAGNITYVARVQRDDSHLRDSFVSFGNNQLSTFQTAGGVILGAFFVIAMVMMASTEGIAVVIFATLGLVLIGILKLIELNWISFILLLTMAVLIVWKLARRTN